MKQILSKDIKEIIENAVEYGSDRGDLFRKNGLEIMTLYYKKKIVELLATTEKKGTVTMIKAALRPLGNEKDLVSVIAAFGMGETTVKDAVENIAYALNLALEKKNILLNEDWAW